jgi:MPBQ/MSBQ methyltransferase
MHFGYYRPWMNLFAREPMLEQMNEAVLASIGLDRNPAARLLDMGCGLGATARHAAARYPAARVTGISIVPLQIDRARELSAASIAAGRVTFAVGDYQATQFESQSFDGVYALESSCHAAGAAKERLLREAHRVLRPGGRLVIADAFLKRTNHSPLTSSLLRRMCRCWVIEQLGELDAFAAALARCGFDNIRIDDLRWRVAPSALHIPLVTLRFLIGELMVKRTHLSRDRWNNALAPMMALLLAMPGGPLGYYLISATRSS